MSNALHRARRALSAAAVSVAVAAAVAGGGCSEGDMPQGPADDRWLSDLIRLAPADYEPGWLYFANQKKMRDIAGADEFKGFPSIWESSGDGIVNAPAPSTYEPLTLIDIHFFDGADKIYEALGVDPFYFDDIIGVRSVDHQTPSFLAVRSDRTNDADLPEVIEGLGYNKRYDDGLTYYHWYDDDDARKPRAHESPFGFITPMLMVAMSVQEDRLFMSKKSTFLLKALRTQQGDSLSLYDRKPYRQLAQAIAPDLVSGFFLKPEFIVRGWADAITDDTLDRYTTRDSPWDVLEPYSAVVMGSGYIEQRRHLFIGLHFPDPAAADRNIDEMKHRWNTARLIMSESKLATYNVDEPFNAFCAPLEARAVLLEDASILIARCPLTYYASESRPIFPPNTFTDLLVQAHILHFLIPDPNDPVFR